MHEHVRLLAGRRTDGTAVMEEVAAERLPDGTVRMLATPAVADGVVLGDVAEVDADGVARVVVRSGLLGIQVYLPAGSESGDLSDELSRRLGEVGGSVEGGPPRVIVCHAPVAAGFTAVEEAVAEAIGRAEGVEWMFTNVYAEDGSPLGWWDAV